MEHGEIETARYAQATRQVLLDKKEHIDSGVCSNAEDYLALLRLNYEQTSLLFPSIQEVSERCARVTNNAVRRAMYDKSYQTEFEYGGALALRVASNLYGENDILQIGQDIITTLNNTDEKVKAAYPGGYDAKLENLYIRYSLLEGANTAYAVIKESDTWEPLLQDFRERTVRKLDDSTKSLFHAGFGFVVSHFK